MDAERSVRVMDYLGLLRWPLYSAMLWLLSGRFGTVLDDRHPVLISFSWVLYGAFTQWCLQRMWAEWRRLREGTDESPCPGPSAGP